MNCTIQLSSQSLYLAHPTSYPMSKAKQAYLLAGQQSSSVRVLRELARSSCPILRARVAENKATPIPILFELLLDTHADVRISLSQNQSLPLIFLTQLARDEDPDVRYGMAENPFLPVNILEILANDENPYVSHRALKSLSLSSSESPLVRKERDLQIAA